MVVRRPSAGLWGSSPPPKKQVRDAGGAGHGLELEAIEQLLVRGPQSLTLADFDRRNRDVHRVNEVGVEELPNSGDASSDAHVLPVSGLLGLLQRLRGRRIDEVERRVRQREARAPMVGEDED